MDILSFNISVNKRKCLFAKIMCDHKILTKKMFKCAKNLMPSSNFMEKQISDFVCSKETTSLPTGKWGNVTSGMLMEYC
jgi:hypothetical protein